MFNINIIINCSINIKLKSYINFLSIKFIIVIYNLKIHQYYQVKNY